MSDDTELRLRLNVMAEKAGFDIHASGYMLCEGRDCSDELIAFAKLVAEDIAKRTDCRCAHDTQSEKDCKQSLGSRCFRNQAQDIRRYYGL